MAAITKNSPDLVETLATLCERDEAGRHFTETCGCLDELEALGLIEAVEAAGY